MKVAILDDYQEVALSLGDWASLPADVKVTVFHDHLKDMDRVVERLKDFEIIMAMRERTPFGRDFFGRLPNLHLLNTTGMVNAAIDLAAATELGILVCGTQGGGFTAPELAWGLILSLIRHIPLESEAVRQGYWQKTVGIGLKGKVLGILGLGRLGSHMARIGSAFGMTVIAWSHNLTAERAAAACATLVTRDELFARADILSIHLKMGTRNRGIVTARELGLMKPTAYLINTARGPIVDEAALVKALQARTIAGAGLDVFGEEPLPPDHPFRHLDNVIVTPHLGYVVMESYCDYFPDTIENIKAYLRGQPVRVLNAAVLESPRYRRP